MILLVFKFHLFADDTNLLYSNKNVKRLENVVNKELKNLHEWLTANKLTININKSNFVIFCPCRKKINFAINIKMFDNDENKYVTLDCNSYVKYLGVVIDQKLSWKPHINIIFDKISKTFGRLAKLRHYVQLNILLTLYKSLIQPCLLYGLCAWDKQTNLT